MTRVYFDIETCPAQNPEVRAELLAAVKPPTTYKKPESIAEWMKENAKAEAEAAWRKTSFDGALGHICVIGVAIDDEPPMPIYADAWLADEAKVLRAFFEYIDTRISARPNVRPTFIGHNIIEFDFRFLFQRAVMLGVRPSKYIPFNAKPWDDNVFDTMARWAGARDRVKLDKLAKAMGLQLKGSEIGEEIDGSKVWDFVRDGRIADVAKYCAGDIERTRGIHKRMTFSCVEAA